MGMASPEAETASVGSGALPPFGAQFHFGEQQSVFVRRFGKRQRRPEKQRTPIFERFIHFGYTHVSRTMGYSNNKWVVAAATRISHGCCLL